MTRPTTMMRRAAIFPAMVVMSLTAVVVYAGDGKGVYAGGGRAVRARSGEAAQTQNSKPTTLRAVLLAELQSTHTSEEWFVPANIAVKGLTAEQASWTDGKGNHSVGQLAHHLMYWNRRNLERLKGEKLEKFSGNNDETFDKFDAKSWNETVQQLETADEAKLAENAQVFTHISTHNAYHIGQMIYVRKEQRNWDPKNGVR